MKDGSFRRVVKALARARFAVDLRITRWIRARRGRPLYVLKGSCVRCGQCCETPMIRIPSPCFHLRSVRAMILWWHREVNGLELIQTDRKTHTFTFRCTHWDQASKECDSYESRPGFCRDYPRPLLESSSGSFLDRCGHYAVLRQAAKVRAALERLDLAPDKRRELEERLRARE